MKAGSIKPRIIAFEVTRRCRYNCRHCRAKADPAAQHEMSTDQCKKVIKSVADFNRCMLILTGGEPTERTDICELIRYGGSLGLRVVMATCGYSMDTDFAAEMKEAGLVSLSFSLDGADAQTHDSFRRAEGAFDAVMCAAEVVRRAGIRFQINTTISKTNIDQVEAIADLARDIGACCFNPFILVPMGRGREMRDEILAPDTYEKLLVDLLEIKRNSRIEVRVTCGPQFARISRQHGAKTDIGSTTGCMGGKGFGFISSRGDVQTCGFLDISAGNIIESDYDFGRIWTQSPFLQQIRDLSSYKGKCSRCEWLSVCRGCRARAYAVTGDYLAADPVCGYDPDKDKK